MTWLFSFLTMIVKALLGEIRQGIDDARDDQAHEDVGILRQQQADAEAARVAKEKADAIALEPRDRVRTKKDLRDGTF